MNFKQGLLLGLVWINVVQIYSTGSVWEGYIPEFAKTSYAYLFGTNTEKSKEAGKKLFKSAAVGDLIQAKSALETNIDVNLKDNYGDTALIVASKFGNKEIVELLIKKGADVNVQNKLGETALMFAAKNRSLDPKGDIVKLLLKSGAKASLKNNLGETAKNLYNKGLTGTAYHLTEIYKLLDQAESAEAKK